MPLTDYPSCTDERAQNRQLADCLLEADDRLKAVREYQASLVAGRMIDEAVVAARLWEVLR